MQSARLERRDPILALLKTALCRIIAQRQQIVEQARLCCKYVPKDSNFKSKEKFKGKKQSLFDKLKGNDQAVRSPSNTYGPPPEQSNDEPAGDDPLDDDTFPSQPQLSINYDYKYRGPPIMTKDSKGEKGIKKLTKLLLFGWLLCSLCDQPLSQCFPTF